MKHHYLYLSKIGIIYPRFWVRLLLALVIAFGLFWHTSRFGADFKALFSQDQAALKFLVVGLGSVLVNEWMFYVCWYCCPRFDIFTEKKKFFSIVALIALVIPLLLMVVFGRVVMVMPDKDFAAFVNAISLMLVFLTMSNIIMAYISIYTFQDNQFLRFLEVYYGNQLVKLTIADIAYLFDHEGIYLVTSHKGITYETAFEENTAELYAMLNPTIFFKINEQMIISRKACTGYTEVENGRVVVDLVPKPILPKSMQGRGDHGLFDAINLN